MSEQSSSPVRRVKLQREDARGVVPATKGVLARRWPLYAVAGVLGLLVIAYIDGGEEPLHPITQPIALPAAQSSVEGIDL